MIMEPFTESGMQFGPYPDGYCLRIEQSNTYRKIQGGVRMAEFLLLRRQGDGIPCIWIVEAKSSSPRPEASNFPEFIAEIRDKLANALALGIASILMRHPAALADLPDRFKTFDLAATDFRLVLIINGHKKSWLAPLQDALRKALHPTVQTWALGANAVVVINDQDARRFGLISAP